MGGWNSQKTAVAVAVAVAVASTLFGSHRSLAALRRGVEKTVVEGADGSGYSIATDGQDMVNVARNLTTVARKYLADETLFADLEAYCRQMEEAETIEDRLNARGGIRSVSETIQTKLAQQSEVTQTDREYLAGFQIDLEAASHSMAMDPYNDLARQFNEDVLGRFPARALGGLTGVKSLPTFD